MDRPEIPAYPNPKYMNLPVPFGDIKPGVRFVILKNIRKPTIFDDQVLVKIESHQTNNFNVVCLTGRIAGVVYMFTNTEQIRVINGEMQFVEKLSESFRYDFNRRTT